MRQSLVIEGFGTRIRLVGQRLRICQGDEEREFALAKLRCLVVARRGVSLSSDVVVAAAEHDVDLVFMNFDGRVSAVVTPPVGGGTAATRRAQLSAWGTEHGLEVVRRILARKCQHQASLLRYLDRNVRRGCTDRSRATDGAAGCIDQSRAMLMALEGSELGDRVLRACEARAGRVYWRSFGRAVGARWCFRKRCRRGDASDALNSALNYGYAILQSRVNGAVVRAGLDPFAGLLHVDRSGRASMVLDLMEPWRAVVVDRAIATLARRNIDLVLCDEGRLSPKARRRVTKAVLSNLAAPLRTPDGRITTEELIRTDAESLATALRTQDLPALFRWRP